MAKKAQKKLKVYRTAIGFHDAYVAAPSKKAALAAWGTTKDLFARHAAELVEDAALTAEPLAHPGEVIKRARGTAAEQLAALPDKAQPRKTSPKPVPARKASPRPSRANVDRAEQALADAEQRHETEMAVLRREEKALAKRRRKIADAHQAESRKLQGKIDAARDDYETAIARWLDS
ncbi:hypothetical protein FHS31_000454 [Sphingomonas vulcanisoli]|uniref:Cell envelope biogenesis protein TolA n=1 Tax=Sphingomonas vulcanisoli TaxID=1658060 RepID=A0ABX0TMY5_9SPHN|nr:hypothetical protein [Sphingomonas vulcanisoli]NIJ06872.1 hypothetical protein [Sphingomonas vulcanisoli]